MFLGIYRLEGDTSQLRQGYERLLESVPHDGMQLHVCVTDPGGLWIYDTCPSREAFLSFAASPEFRNALKTAGLPEPKVTPVGDVQAAFVAGKRTR